MDQQSLHAWEAKCVQEEAPRCTAACPLHVDARAFSKHMSQGRWNEAWAVLARTMPLPRVLARICDAPCESACLRSERGGAVQIGALEKYCARMVTRMPPQPPLPRKEKTVAVLGAGLAGLSAAWELARKGFTVQLHGRPVQGSLADFTEEILPDAVVQAELERLQKMGVTMLAPHPLEQGTLQALLQHCDAVFLDPEIHSLAETGLDQADPLTLGTDIPGVFSGNLHEMLQPPESPSPARLASLGRRAANSMERFAQGASLTAGREKDGPYESRLHTDISTIPQVPPVSLAPTSDPADQETAIQEEAGRCLQCECLECVKHCAYLEKYGSYPKVYARRIYNNASIVMGTRQANTMINSCMDCGLCETLCPGDFDMGALCLEARRDMVQRGKMPPSAHEFALRDMDFANGDQSALARPAPGGSPTQWLFFPGCQLTASDPALVERVYAWLLQQQPETGLHLACCGAPALWAGQVDRYETSLAELRSSWKQLGSPAVAAACPTCLQTLREALPEADIRSFWEMLTDMDLPSPERDSNTPLAIHDPCGSRQDAALHEDVRTLLERLDIPLVEPKLTKDLTECCGYGGLLCEVDPDLGREVVERRAKSVDHDFVTYCAMCRDRLVRTGKPVSHALDLLFPPPEPNESAPGQRPAPGYSQRRENRARLKERLLQTYWQESSPLRPEHESVTVRLAPGVEERLDQRRILVSDLQKTLLTAQRANNGQGCAFVSESGRLLARHRPVSVTYWVEYEPEPDGGYLVHNAWSHRMRVVDTLKGGDR
ncbi:aldehyde dehydrogenase, iron-sulfur subunit [Paucidesulfovibrio gracilis DSM 16080]|uniref:Aldehyde dehydrogenase, iron-sulfur subunit n=1 Tax=Paucidesulfovibrio gracilis DSM 16080 TaxID=1121449 RepID=A0A1T4X6L8_9BACT|nr:pyridine nucleotide-disulfide oxidoreductase/dicluster-binding protein [Paucidesulfovibrio gracilis]SKA84748.1 aldehyde dehydrogenase, iron-sulfur subunit [Paucidesulfovibrio gracilis DSM 16080]